MSVPQQLSSFNNQIPPRYLIKNITKAYSVVPADYGSIISYNGTSSATISLPPATSVGAGFNCWILSQPLTSGSFSGAITIDPNGSETIAGLSTFILYSSEGTQIVSDGKNWQVNSKKTMVAYAENSAYGGTRPIASGTSAIAIGPGSEASGPSSVAFGFGAGARGTSACSFGNSIANNPYAISFGANATANAINEVAIGAGGGTAGYKFGYLPLCATTTDATPTVLTSNLGAPTNSNQLALDNTVAIVFDILVVARQQGLTATAAWKITGLIREDSGVASTVIVGTPTITTISNVPGWSIAVSADTTYGCLAVTATGAASTNISWSAVVSYNRNFY